MLFRTTIPRSAHVGFTQRLAKHTRSLLLTRAKPWRPHIDDVERLSKGDGAKIRGTGSREIPHRLNAEERPRFETAKKKGYLAVRGTGYRKERRGNPLPNVFRQWCDARGLACVVVEQAMLGEDDDCVVVDLTPLRMMDTCQAEAACMEVASAMGVRRVPPSERGPDFVPFNVIPSPSFPPGSISLGSTGAESSGEGTGSFPSDTVSPLGGSQRDGSVGAGSSGEGSMSSAVQEGSTSHSDSSRDSNASSSSSAHAPSAPTSDGLEAVAAEVQRQAATVRELKEGQGLPNWDPAVEREVAVLKALKERLQRVELEEQQQRRLRGAAAPAAASSGAGVSGRLQAMHDAFSAGPSDTAGLSSGSASVRTPGAPGSSGALSPDAPSVAITGLSSDSVPSTALLPPLLGPKLREGQGGEHPYLSCAIWQLPAQPLFFQADRATAKAFAKRVAEAVQVKVLGAA